MMWLHNTSIRSKLLLCFALILSMILVVGIVNQNRFGKIQEQQSFLYDHVFHEQTLLQKSLIDINHVRVLVLEAPHLVGVERDASVRKIRSLAAAIEKATATIIDANKDDAEMKTTVRELSINIREFLDELSQEVIPALQSAQRSVDNDALSMRQGKRIGLIRDLVSRLNATAESQVDGSVANAKADIDSTLTLSLILIGALVVGCLLLSVLLDRLIAKPVKEISRVAGVIGNGDLAVEIPSLGRRDEVGTLAENFRKMIVSLREMERFARQIASRDLTVTIEPRSESDALAQALNTMVQNIRRVTHDIGEAVGVIGSATKELSASSAQLAASATETATAVSETTTTVEEVRQTSAVASQKAKTVSDNAQRAVATSENGKRATDETIDAMTKIGVQMESIAASIIKLSEQSKAIAEIIATVTDLAEQTNLLAVNAAIEAARAGDQGRGFVVVAQEVKNLADQSKQATTQIKSILSDIQTAIGTAVMATEQGNKAVDSGLRLSSISGEAIQELSVSIEESAQSAFQIATFSKQQSVGMEQVAVAMENIKSASGQNAATTKELESTARNLDDMGHRLKSLVDLYRVA